MNDETFANTMTNFTNIHFYFREQKQKMKFLLHCTKHLLGC